MQRIGIEYVITGTSEGAIAAMRRASAGAEETANVLERTGGKMKSLGSGMISFGRSLSYVSLPLAALGVYAVKSAVQFQTSMTLLQTQAGASAKEVGKLNKEIIGLSGKGAHGFGPNELAEALYPIRSDGFKAAEAMKVLSAASAGARVSGAGLTLTANALGGVLRTYGVSGPEAAAKAMDSLNATVGFGKFKLEELDDALTSGFLTAAKRAGVGLNETGDALDALARKSIPPQVEATRLQKTFIQFGTVTGIAQKYLAKIGISQLQLAKDMKDHGLIFALEDLKKHLGNLSTEEQNVVLGEAFGRSKGSANVGALLEALPEMKKIQKEREHYNTLQQALAGKEKTSQYQIDVAVAELKKSLIGLGQILIPIVIPMFTKMAKIVGELAQWFTKLPKPVREAGVYFGIAVVLGGPLLIFFGNLIKAGGLILTLFGKLGPAAATGAAEVGAETGAFATAGTLLGDAFLSAFSIAGPYAAEAAILYVLNKIHPSVKHGGEAKGHGWSGAKKGNRSLLELAEGAVPFSSAEGEAGLTPREERAQLDKYYRTQYPYGVGAPSKTAGLYGGNSASEQPIQVKVDLSLDSKPFAEVISTHVRNNPSGLAAKYFTEAINKRIKNEQARMP